MYALVFRLGLFLIAMVPAWVQAGDAAPLAVEQAWIRLVPPNAPVLAGYAGLRNATDAPLALASLHSDDFGAVELHEMRHVDGVMRMDPLALRLAPGESIELAPGGAHLMLMRPAAPLAAGARVVVEFRFEGGAVQPVEFEVRGAAPAAD